MSTPIGGRAFLPELELDVSTELTLAQTSQPEEDAVGPVEYNHAERFLAQYGLTKDELISRRGGSP